MICHLARKPITVIASSASAVLIIAFGSAHIPPMLGIGQANPSTQMTLSAYFPDGAGVVRPDSTVTDRGVAIGKVTTIDFTSVGVRLNMSIDDSVQIGLDATATIHPTAAPGQTGQFSVDLVSDQSAGPYLSDGSMIPLGRTELPPEQTIAGLLNTLATMTATTRTTA
jgi:phospholipid/cholesterol/gamma-HCH transport system substrate-binding protein